MTKIDPRMKASVAKSNDMFCYQNDVSTVGASAGTSLSQDMSNVLLIVYLVCWQCAAAHTYLAGR